jgi:predicted alpha-1,2-mannosidase
MATVLVLAAVAWSLPGATSASAADPTPHHRLDLTRYVDPFISVRHPKASPQTPITGTSANGNTFPGADRPFGMVQWSPDTEGNAPGGYRYDDHTITGFSLTHLSGAGCRIFGDIPFLPTAAALDTSPAASLAPYDSGFSHASESASPGDYSVTLTRWSIGVELTTTVRAGMGAVRYPAGAPAHLLINAGHSANGTQRSTVSVVGSNQVTGSATSGHLCGHPGSYTVHFAVQFDHPFRVWSVWNGSRVTHHGRAAAGVHVGASVGFGTPDVPTTVLARVGISFVSVGNALANLRAEIPNWSFDTVRSAATDAWNAALNHIQVSGGTAAEREIFYTALYHSLLFPSVFSDTNGQYVGMDGAVHADDGHPQYTNVSGWDVYRSQIPLLALLFPQRTSDIVRSLLRDATQSGGWLPKWAIAGSTTNTMNGDSADAIIAGAYAFGARDFDAGAALSQMIRGATVPGTGPDGYLERPGLAQYLDHGYVAYSYGPRDLESSAATTLEYATDDFAIARLAAALDRWSVWSTFMRRAQNWQRLFNPATGFVQPRMADGSFGAHFVPESERGFREGDAWQYAWMVPQNLGALVRAMEGGPAVADRLRTFFTMLRGGRSSPWYQGSNELDLEAPWEFDFAGQPWGTQEVVRRIVTRLYTDGPSGLPGNDDLGAMSSWYVWAAIGLYPEIPGVAGLAVASPLFTDVDVDVPGDAWATIVAPGAEDDAPYVTRLTVDGEDRSAPWLPLTDLTEGRTIAFELATTPDTSWGTDAAPPSFTGGQAPGIAFTEPSGAITVPRGGTRSLVIGVQSVVDTGLDVTWSVTAPAGVHVVPDTGRLSLAGGGG